MGMEESQREASSQNERREECQFAKPDLPIAPAKMKIKTCAA